MKTKFTIFGLLLLMISVISCSDGVKHFEWEKHVGAKSMPKTDNVFYANRFGAVGNGVTMNTRMIQNAIDSCAARGGGVVKFIPGIYITGSIFVKSGVTLQIDKGVMIRASQNLDDYKQIATRVAGVETEWPAAIINIIDQENAAITGNGTIDGRGKPFWEKYWSMREDYNERGLRWIVDYDCQRPQGILVQNCKNVTVKDFVLYQAGFWAVHILYSQFVTIDGITVSNNINGSGPSTDGIDVDSSCDILIQNCDISCNDDNFCMKAGRDADGLRVNRPTERVVIRNCIARYGDGLFTCGSETSGGIRDIVAYNLTAIGTKVGLRFKSAFTRGGIVENIYLSDITMTNVRDPFVVDLNWYPAYSYSTLPETYNYDSIPHHWKVMLEKVDEAKGMPTFRNIYFENVKAVGSKVAMVVNASEKSTIDGFSLKNFSIEAEEPGKMTYAKNWNIENVSITAKNGEKITMENCENVNIQ